MTFFCHKVYCSLGTGICCGSDTEQNDLEKGVIDNGSRRCGRAV